MFYSQQTFRKKIKYLNENDDTKDTYTQEHGWPAPTSFRTSTLMGMPINVYFHDGTVCFSTLVAAKCIYEPIEKNMWCCYEHTISDLLWRCGVFLGMNKIGRQSHSAVQPIFLLLKSKWCFGRKRIYGWELNIIKIIFSKYYYCRNLFSFRNALWKEFDFLVLKNVITDFHIFSGLLNFLSHL